MDSVLLPNIFKVDYLVMGFSLIYALFNRKGRSYPASMYDCAFPNASQDELYPRQMVLPIICNRKKNARHISI